MIIFRENIIREFFPQLYYNHAGLISTRYFYRIGKISNAEETFSGFWHSLQITNFVTI